MEADTIRPIVHESCSVEVVSIPFALSELEEFATYSETEEIRYSSLGDECFNFPDDDESIREDIRYSEIEIDSDAVRRLMFD